MTFEQLNEKLGGNLVAADWHQASGGGWVENTARVDNEANVRNDAVVSGSAQVSG
jgi:hypothetical protein